MSPLGSLPPGGGTTDPTQISTGQDETNILNGALGAIGAARVTGIDDGSVNANWCKTYYPNLRRTLLQIGTWSFAEDRKQLEAKEEVPLFEFVFKYSLPSDLLRLKCYNGNLLMPPAVYDLNWWMVYRDWYKIEGQYLLSNDGQVYIVYVKDIGNPSLWSPLFYQTLEQWLASKLAAAILKSEALADAKLKAAMGLYLPLAAVVDAQQQPIHPYVVDDLTWGRY